jgi:hypothetical protein
MPRVYLPSIKHFISTYDAGAKYARAWSLLLQVQAGVLALERRTADAASNTARGGWGSTAAQHEPAVSEQDLAAMQQDVAKMHDNYGALLKEFLTGLPAAANEVRITRHHKAQRLPICAVWLCIVCCVQGCLHSTRSRQLLRARKDSQTSFKGIAQAYQR